MSPDPPRSHIGDRGIVDLVRHRATAPRPDTRKGGAMPTALSHRPRRAAPADRCDRRPAAVVYRGVLPTGELLFCGDHVRQHRPRLLMAGATLSAIPHAPDRPDQCKGPRP